MSRKPKVPTAAALIKKVATLPQPPVAFQALWDGDTDGWGLSLAVVLASGGTYRSSELAFLRFGGDIRLFQGAVPPWPEAQVGAELGATLAAHFRVPFWFPAPNAPDGGCPSWWEQDRAHPCEDCGKLILPQTSPHLPKEVCYPCHLQRERRARLRNDEPASPRGVTVLVGRGAELQRVGYATEATDLAIARFALETPERAAEAQRTGELTLAGAEVQQLEAQLRARVRAQLDAFVPGREGGFPKDAEIHRKVMFEGRELSLEIRFDRAARELHDAIHVLDGAARAVRDGQHYWLVFRHGMTARTDRVLRTLRAHDGHATVDALLPALRGDLDEAEVRATIARLVALSLVVEDGDAVRCTVRGLHLD